MINQIAHLILGFLIISMIFTAVPIVSVEGQNNDQGFGWVSQNYDTHQTNFSPQNQITIDTIQLLTDEWTNAFVVPPIVSGIELQPGLRARPLAKDGLIFLPTNFIDVFVHNIATGLPLWAYAYPVNMTQVILEFPTISPYNSGVLEEAGIFENLLMFPTPDCGMVFLDHLTGIPEFRGELTRGQMCDNIEGNNGYYTGQIYSSPVVYEKERILITGTSVSGKAESGRGYIAGFNVDSGELLWRFFLMPPAGGDKDWAMQYQGLGNVDPVPDDWGNAINVGVGMAIGQWAIDEETGIVYVGTSAPGPNFNAVNRPGPNLFSSSILALDAATGELIWYYQASSHDLSGHGCNWNTLLGNIEDRKVLFKACDDGKLIALDAADGELIWSFSPPDVKSTVDSNNLNKNWPHEPSTDGFWHCPGITGASAGNIAFAYGKIFYITTNYCDFLKVVPDSENDLNSFGAEILTCLPEAVRYYKESDCDPTLHIASQNSTVYAVNALDGNIVWSNPIPDMTHLGGLLVTGNLVIYSGLDGKIHALNSVNGDMIFEKFIGASLGTSPVIGAAASGEQFLFQSVGGLPERFGQPVAGVFVAQNILGGPQVPIVHDEIEAVDLEADGELPLNIVIPALVLILLVFIFTAFGPSRIKNMIKK